MINKDNIIGLILQSEGGYSNLVNDAGGETYRGITRKNYPDWKGWAIVDKRLPLKQGAIIQDANIEKLVSEFYTENFLDKLRFDDLNSDMIRVHLFDMSVNAGIKNAVKLLQKAINKVYNINILTDGIIGNITLKHCNNVDKQTELEKEYINQRINYYTGIVIKHPKNKVFLKGWLNRINNTSSFINNQ